MKVIEKLVKHTVHEISKDGENLEVSASTAT